MEELHSTKPKLSQKSLKQTGQSSNQPDGSGDGDVVGIADANSNGGSEGTGERVLSMKRLTVKINRNDCKRYSIGKETANLPEKHGVKNSANANSPSKTFDVLQVLFFFHL